MLVDAAQNAGNRGEPHPNNRRSNAAAGVASRFQ